MKANKAPTVFYPEIPELPKLENKIAGKNLNIISSFQERGIIPEPPKVFYPEIPDLSELEIILADQNLNIISSLQERDVKFKLPTVFYPEIPKLEDLLSNKQPKNLVNSIKKASKLAFKPKIIPIDIKSKNEQKPRSNSNPQIFTKSTKENNYAIFTFEFENRRKELKLSKDSQLKDHIKTLQESFNIKSDSEMRFKTQLKGGSEVKNIENLEKTMNAFTNDIIHIYSIRYDFTDIKSRSVQIDENENKMKTKKKYEGFTIIDASLLGHLQSQLHNKKRFLGEGRTSQVYKVNHINENNNAYDEVCKTFYAIKIIKKHLVKIAKPKMQHKFKSWDDDDDDKEYDDKSDENQNENEEEEDDDDDDELDINKLKNFLAEYEIIHSLKHKNIIKAMGFSFGDKKYSPFILLEYISHNLDNSIDILDDVYLVSIIYEISQAMKFIHEQGIIHRDLKPSNILLDKNKHVKICDFGIAKLMNNETQSTSELGSGTRRYMAPELFQGNKFTDKVDVYSFGVVVHFILTRGELPEIIIGKKNQIKISNKINQNSKELIKRCLSFSFEERPSFIDIVGFIEENEMKLIDGIDMNNKILHSQII